MKSIPLRCPYDGGRLWPVFYISGAEPYVQAELQGMECANQACAATWDEMGEPELTPRVTPGMPCP